MFSLSLDPELLETELIYDKTEYEAFEKEDLVLNRIMKEKGLDLELATDATHKNVDKTVQGEKSENPTLENDLNQFHNLIKIRVTTIGKYFAFLQNGEKSSSDFAKKSAFASTCGSDGTKDNGYYDDGEIVLCPGFIARMVSQVSNQLEFEELLNATLSHELGHSDEYSIHPKTYADLRNCYDNAIKKVSGKDQTVTPHLREATADFWAGDSVI